MKHGLLTTINPQRQTMPRVHQYSGVASLVDASENYITDFVDAHSWVFLILIMGFPLPLPESYMKEPTAASIVLCGKSQA
jgi:hypothetical protein